LAQFGLSPRLHQKWVNRVNVEDKGLAIFQAQNTETTSPVHNDTPKETLSDFSSLQRQNLQQLSTNYVKIVSRSPEKEKSSRRSIRTSFSCHQWQPLALRINPRLDFNISRKFPTCFLSTSQDRWVSTLEVCQLLLGQEESAAATRGMSPVGFGPCIFLRPFIRALFKQ
jgi:hypothetical protein